MHNIRPKGLRFILTFFLLMLFSYQRRSQIHFIEGRSPKGRGFFSQIAKKNNANFGNFKNPNLELNFQYDNIYHLFLMGLIDFELAKLTGKAVFIILTSASSIISR